MLVLLVAGLIGVQAAIPPPYTDPNNTRGWVLQDKWSDEFEEEGLDRSMWTTTTNRIGVPPGLFMDHNVKVQNGSLQLWAQHEVLNASMAKLGYHDYTTAEVATQSFSASYGYYEVKMKAGSSSITSSWWFFSGPRDDGWATEFDVFELCGIGHASMAHQFPTHSHIWKTPFGPVTGSTVADKCHCTPNQQPTCVNGTQWKAPFVFSDGYHIVGFEWDTKFLKVYVDGELRYLKENYCQNTPMQMRFNRATWSWYSFPPIASLPDSPFTIDYLRMWVPTRDGTEAEA